MSHPHDEILFSRDTGTDVVDILAGCIYVPVVSHSQCDIKSLESIVIALKHEHQFFKNHPSYKSKAQCCGTPWLARWLNIVSIIHLQDVHLPAWLLTLTWASVRSSTTLPLYFVLVTCLIELFCISIYGYSISQRFPTTGTNNLSYAWISHTLHLSRHWALDFASSAADYPIVDLVPSNLWISDGMLAVVTADFKIRGIWCKSHVLVLPPLSDSWNAHHKGTNVLWSVASSQGHSDRFWMITNGWHRQQVNCGQVHCYTIATYLLQVIIPCSTCHYGGLEITDV